MTGQLWDSGHSQIHVECDTRSLTLQADGRKETDAWLHALKNARAAGKNIEDQLLTKVGFCDSLLVVENWYTSKPNSLLLF